MTKKNNLRAKIKARQSFIGMSNADMAAKLRMSERSYSRHLAEIEKVTVGELLRLEQILKIRIFEET